MAFYILIRKLKENETSALYAFGEDEDKTGLIEVDKGSGDVNIVENAGNIHDAVCRRAMWKLQQHWKSGEYPESTCWAS